MYSIKSKHAVNYNLASYIDLQRTPSFSIISTNPQIAGETIPRRRGPRYRRFDPALHDHGLKKARSGFFDSGHAPTSSIMGGRWPISRSHFIEPGFGQLTASRIDRTISPRPSSPSRGDNSSLTKRRRQFSRQTRTEAAVKIARRSRKGRRFYKKRSCARFNGKQRLRVSPEN